MGTTGPSKEEKAAQERLRQIQEQQLATQTQTMTAASAPDPLADALRAEDLGFLNWEQGKSGPVDITKAPGLGAPLDLFNRAKSKREGERAGIGVLKLGMDQSNPELASRIAEQHQTEREQDAAGSLENAYNVRRAEVHGSALPLIAGKQNKDLGIASLASGNSANATDAYLRMLLRPRQRSFMQQMLLNAATGAHEASMAAAG